MPQAPLKDGLSRPAVQRLADNIHTASAAFDSESFIAAATQGLDNLELKERVGHVADVLALFLPPDYSEAVAIIVKAGATWDRGDEDDPLRGFAAWPLFHFIEHYGLDEFERSMAALRSITGLFSAEFAVRPYIARYPEQAFTEIEKWIQDDSEQVRRLVSECTRPRLPWATKVDTLVADPAPIFRLLDQLKDDPALYVRRSVANNLNDIAKDHPELVIDLCEQWQQGASAERQWVIERATRTLVKQGHPRVWGLLGFAKEARVEVSDLNVEPTRLRMGEQCQFRADVTSIATEDQRLAIDYAMHFVKANGKTRAKVFKLKVVTLRPGEVHHISKIYSFRPISTRAYYPGGHFVEILVNGKGCARTEFELDG